MKVLDLPVAGNLAALAQRLRLGAPYLYRPIGRFARWLVTSHETTNLTYDLDPVNKHHLVTFVSEVADIGLDEAAALIREAEDDEDLARHIRDGNMGEASRRRVCDAEVRFGRRLGWYALVRARRPRLVVETGVDKGMGACLLCAALRRNALEGHPGRYIGTELDPDKGYLLSGPYADVGRIARGDSIESLRRLDGPIDLFINDSDHSEDYEAREYEVIADKLGADALILSDNWATEKLYEFALQSGRRFLFFREEPLDHWYPGDGIAAAFGRARQRQGRPRP